MTAYFMLYVDVYAHPVAIIGLACLVVCIEHFQIGVVS